jgi:stress response protein YsnF
MAQTVIGFFDDASEAQRAVERLVSKGISRERIDVSRGSSGGSASTSTVSSPDIIGDHPTADGRTVDEKGRNTNRFTDFFNSLFGGGDDDDKDRYSRVAERSNSIVTVHAQSGDEAETASEILDDCGAVDVDERAAQYGYSNSRSTQNSGRQDVDSERETTIPRIEENLEVGKRTVESGGVRVRSRIVERPVEEHVRLREENVHVERESVDRPLSSDDRSAFQERDIEMTERKEVPVVAKEARVVEEVRVSKDVNERDETISGTVRNTEVDVENLDKGTRRSDSDIDDDTRSSRGTL